MLNGFVEATGVSCSILDLNGDEIAAAGGQDACRRFHRATEASRARCQESDTLLAGRLGQGQEFTLYRCPMGLADAASPIHLENEHVANAFVGQFLLEPPDLGFFRRQAEQYGYPVEDYLEAIARVPVLPHAQLSGVLAFLTSLAELAGAVGLEQQREREARRALEESEHRYRALFASAGDAILLAADGRVVDCNPKALALFGLEHEAVVGLDVRALWPERQPGGGVSEGLFEQLREQALAGTPCAGEWRFQRTDGTVFSADVTLTRVDLGGRACLQAIVRDITDRAEMDRRLRTLTRGLRGVVDATADLIGIDDLDLLLRTAVQTVRERFGLERCSLYLYRNGLFRGTYGTDMAGQTVDEHGAEFRYDRLETVVHEARQRGIQWLVDDGVDQTYWNGREMHAVAQGWVASTPILGARGPVGVLFNDAAISGKPLDPVSQEIVSLYCSSVGALVEKLNAEAELSEARALLAAAIDQLPAGVLVVDVPDLTVLHANPATAALLGAEDPASLIGEPLLPVVEPVVWESADGAPLPLDSLPVVRAAREGAFVRDQEVRIRSGERVRAFLGSAAPVRDADGEVVAAVSAVSEITEQRAREARRTRRLEETAALRRVLLELATEPSVAAGDLAAAAPVITEGVARGLGLARVSVWLAEDGMERIRCRDLYAEGGHSGGAVSLMGRHEAYLAGLESGRAIEAVDARTDPRTAGFAADYLEPLGIVSLIDAPIRQSGNVVGVLCCEHTGPEPREWRDYEVSFASEAADLVAQVALSAKRREAELALRRSEEQFGLLVDHAPECIFVQTDRVFAYANPATLRMLGASSPEELLGSATGERLAPEYREQGSDPFAATSQLPVPHGATECVFLRLDGAAVPAETTSVPILYQGRESVLVFARDISERRLAEAERAQFETRLQRAQRLESLGALAGGIAHDFNNILAAIVGFGELALQEASPDSCQQAYLDQILTASTRARDLVRQVLAFSRQAQTERRPVRVQAVLEEAIELLRASLPATVEIRQRIDPEAPAVLADASQLQQVIVNLCTNAEHAMRGQGGVLTITLQPVEVDAAQAATLGDISPGPYVRIGVRDTGRGMDAAIVERIFEPFFTTKPTGEGTGLGLATSHGIIAGHGGAISVHSQVGAGSSFHVYLPCGGEPTPVRPRARSGPARGGDESILLVDDEPALVSTGEIMLSRLGYRVTALQSSIEALELLQREPEAFDLLVTDHTMPNLTGLDLAARAQAARPGLPVVVTTGYGHQVDSEAARMLGVGPILLKPYSLQQLAEAVRGALDAGRSREAPASEGIER